MCMDWLLSALMTDFPFASDCDCCLPFDLFELSSDLEVSGFVEAVVLFELELVEATSVMSELICGCADW